VHERELETVSTLQDPSRVNANSPKSSKGFKASLHGNLADSALGIFLLSEEENWDNDGEDNDWTDDEWGEDEGWGEEEEW
jgi:hypothetical protein